MENEVFFMNQGFYLSMTENKIANEDEKNNAIKHICNYKIILRMRYLNF